MIVHTFDLSTQEIEADDSLEFEARLLCIVVSRTVRATPVSKWEGGSTVVILKASSLTALCALISTSVHSAFQRLLSSFLKHTQKS